MQLPLQITFRNLARSEAVAAKVEERAAKLEQYTSTTAAAIAIMSVSKSRCLSAGLSRVASRTSTMATRMFTSLSEMPSIRYAGSLRITRAPAGAR